MSEWLTPKRAGLLIGVSPSTIRVLVSQGQLEAKRINARGDRRISSASIREYLTGSEKDCQVARKEGLYARVSGRGDQLSSLDSQEKELRASIEGEPVIMIREIGSGLNDNRRGLTRLLHGAKEGKVERVTVTHSDRLTRFGFQLLEQLFNSYGVELRVLHDDAQDDQQELMRDFTSLLASFSGRMYGKRSAAARKRLIKESAASEV